MKPTATLAFLLESFFTQRRLMSQRQASPHTICSYRDTFRLLLQFTQRRLNKPPSQLTFEEIDAPLVAAFLESLEKNRGISARSRNLRLTAIRSFFRYAAYEEPSRSSQIQRVSRSPVSAILALWSTSWSALKSTRCWGLLIRQRGSDAATTPYCW